MTREAITKAFMVTALLGALVLTVKFAMDAQEADKARRAAAENPSDARKQEIQGIMRRAIHAHRQLDFETAEKLLVQASERYPRVAAVWLNLGICYRSLDKLDAADRAFARVLQLDPEDWDAVAERATIRITRGDRDQAFEMLASIPANRGQVQERLRSDPLWRKHRKDPRMPPLMKKHGVVVPGETGVSTAKNVIRVPSRAPPNNKSDVTPATEKPNGTPPAASPARPKGAPAPASSPTP